MIALKGDNFDVLPKLMSRIAQGFFQCAWSCVSDSLEVQMTKKKTVFLSWLQAAPEEAVPAEAVPAAGLL